MTANHSSAPSALLMPRAGVTIIAVILIVWALRETMVVTMPLIFAFFVTVIAYPVFAATHGWLPRGVKWVSYILTMGTVLGVLALILVATWFSLSTLENKIPDYVNRLREIWVQLRSWATVQDLPLPALAGTMENLGARLAGYVPAILKAFWSVGVYLVLIFFFSLLMLIETKRWEDKLAMALPSSTAAAWRRTTTQIAHKIQQYLVMRAFISLVSAAAAGVWLWLMKIDFIAVWVLLTFALNFIPNIGSVISSLLPSFLALIQLGPGTAVATLIGLAVIEQVIGNFLDPNLQGHRLDVSPLVVLVSVLFWAWVWGLAGALLAVPIMTTVMIICSHAPGWEPVARLLSRTGATVEEETGGPKAP